LNNKVEYWLNLCDDNMISAKWLLKGDRYLDTAFFCHQITEKALKAVVANVTGETEEFLCWIKQRLGKLP